jgi:hypothetical protein
VNIPKKKFHKNLTVSKLLITFVRQPYPTSEKIERLNYLVGFFIGCCLALLKFDYTRWYNQRMTWIGDRGEVGM